MRWDARYHGNPFSNPPAQPGLSQWRFGQARCTAHKCILSARFGFEPTIRAHWFSPGGTKRRSLPVCMHLFPSPRVHWWNCFAKNNIRIAACAAHTHLLNHNRKLLFLSLNCPHPHRWASSSGVALLQNPLRATRNCSRCKQQQHGREH